MFYQILALLKTKKPKMKQGWKSIHRKTTNPKRNTFKRSLTDIYNMICTNPRSEDIPFIGDSDANKVLLDDIKSKIEHILSDTRKSSFFGSDVGSNEASFDHSISVPFKQGSTSPRSDVPKMFEDETFVKENEKSALLTQIYDLKQQQIKQRDFVDKLVK